MKLLALTTLALLLTSCRMNGLIIIENNRPTNLRIETYPIITSTTGAWEKGIHYYNKDSIIWTYSLGNNIKSKIIQPNNFKSKDSTIVYTGYRDFRYDTAQNGIYEMYPNSSFAIGELNTYKKTIPTKGNLNGSFTINKLIIYMGTDTLIAKNKNEIWDLLLMADKNKANFNKKGKHKKIRDWIVSIE